MNIIKLCVTWATAERKIINEVFNDILIETISLTDWSYNSY